MKDYRLLQTVFSKHGVVGHIEGHHDDLELVWVKWSDYPELCEESLCDLYENDPTDKTVYHGNLITPPELNKEVKP